MDTQLHVSHASLPTKLVEQCVEVEPLKASTPCHHVLRYPLEEEKLGIPSHHHNPSCLRHFALAPPAGSVLAHLDLRPSFRHFDNASDISTNDNNMRLDSAALPPPLQGFQVGNSDVLYIKSRRNNTTGQCIILWKDILQAFGDVKHVRDGPTIVSFVTDDDFEL
jgi:hypothetical protein